MALKKTIVLSLDSSQFQQGVQNAESSLDGLDQQLDETNSKLESTGDSFDEMGQEADNTAQAVVDMSEQLRNGVQILQAVAQTVRSVTEASMEYAQKVSDIATETNMSAESIQQLSYIATQTGTDIEHVSSAITKLQSSMDSARQGTGQAAEVFRQLGISVTDSNGRMRDSSEVFLETISRLGEVRNSTEQAQQATKLFGESAKELNGMIQLGNEGLVEMAQEFNELGLGVSDDDIQSLLEAQRAVTEMKTAFMASAAELAATFAPVITKVADWLANISPEARQIIMVVGLLTATFVGLTMALTALGTIIPVVTAAAGMATATFTAQALPILAVIAAVAALVIALKELIDMYREWKDMTGNDSFFDFLFDSDGNNQSGGGGHSRNAKGTDYWRGGLTWVGEEGPEIVSLPTGSRIYNNKQSTSIGGNTYNVNMNMDMSRMKSINDVVEAVEGLKTSAGCVR